MIAVFLSAVLVFQPAPLAAHTAADHHPETEVSEAEVASAAHALAEATRQQGFQAIFQWVDDRSLTERLLANGTFTPELELEIREEVRAEQLLSFVFEDIGEHGSFDYLGIISDDDGLWARFRAVNTHLGVTYHDLEFGKDPKGTLRIVDIRPMMVGIRLSTYLGIFMEAAFASDADDPVARRLAEYLLSAGEIDEFASGELAAVPTDAITERNALIVRSVQAQAAIHDSVEAMEAALAAFGESFPDHPSLPSRRLELAILQGDRGAALRFAAQADLLVDDPLAAEIRRGRLLAEFEEIESAVAHLHRALEIDARSLPSALFLLGTAILSDDFAGIAGSLDHLETHLGFSFSPEQMVGNAHFERFMESEEYATWLETR